MMGPYSRLVTILFLLIRTIPPIFGESIIAQQDESDNAIVIVNSGEISRSMEENVQNVTESIIIIPSMNNETIMISSVPEVLSSSELIQNILSSTFPSDENKTTSTTTTVLPLTNSSETKASEEEDEPSLLPLPPEKLQQSPLSSLLLGGSSESLQNFLKTRGFAFSPGDAPPDPVELNELLSRLKPKQGRFDPALLDIINNNNGGFLPSNLEHIFGNHMPKRDENESINIGESQSVVAPQAVVEEEDNIWAPSLPPRGKPHRRIRNRFSSKYKRNETATPTTTTPPPPETAPRPDRQPGPGPTSSLQPFSHITDPNLRNHRLYDWELEKNFTSIDQMEDLLADSSEVSSVVVEKAPPGVVTTPGWVPKPRPKNYAFPPVRPISMEGTQFDSSGDLHDNNPIPHNTFVKFPSSNSDSAGDLDMDEVTEPFNLLRPRAPKRPREPLRESSTENLIFTHKDGLGETGLSSSLDKRRLDRYRSEEGVRSQEQEAKRKFRPSPADKVGVAPPVFVDPDQDFFTSTIRNYDKNDNEHENEKNVVVPSFIRPMRRPQNKGNRQIKDIEKDNKRGGGGDIHRGEKRKRRPVSEEAVTDLDRDPRPYPPNDDDHRDHRDRPTPIPGSNEEDETSYTKSHPTRKSDRILVHPDDLNSNSQSELQQSYYNFYPVRSQFGPASNEQGHPHYTGGDNYPEPQQQDGQQQLGYPEYPEHYTPAKSGVVLDHNGEQIYSGGYDDKFHNPFAAADSQPEYSSYAPNSNEGWSNTYWILGGLIALSAFTAFLIPTLLNSMGRNGKIRNDLQDDPEYLDDQTTSPASSASSTLASLFGNKKKKPPSNTDDYSDPTADTDLWTEIKGVYGDVVKIVRGDYGGIVNKLSGFSKDKDKDKIGPNIVYRDDDQDLVEDDHVDLEDDFDYETKNKKKQTFVNRKGKAKPKIVKAAKKNRNIASSINYVVSNSSPGTVVVKSKSGAEQETSRSVALINDTMATFYMGPSSSSRPFTLFPSPPQPPPVSASSDGFLGEWAKVQLIGS